MGIDDRRSGATTPHAHVRFAEMRQSGSPPPRNAEGQHPRHDHQGPRTKPIQSLKVGGAYTTGKKLIAVAICTLISLSISSPSSSGKQADPPRTNWTFRPLPLAIPYRAVQADEWSPPSTTPKPRLILRETLSSMPRETMPPRPRQPQQAPVVVAKTSDVPSKRSGQSVSGIASWYCKAGVSVCHHSYPPGSMVAAACGKLRAAMSPSWRGQTVTVSGGGNQVTVKLVDWCGSSTKLIDLYWEPMSRLGGTGVLPVTVRW